jgi:hypothetical protein
MTLRIWPFYVWFHVTAYRVFSQGGRWYDHNEVPGTPEWYAAPQRHVTRGFAVRCGFTWADRKSYRDDDPNYPAPYIVLGDSE